MTDLDIVRSLGPILIGKEQLQPLTLGTKPSFLMQVIILLLEITLDLPLGLDFRTLSGHVT